MNQESRYKPLLVRLRRLAEYPYLASLLVGWYYLTTCKYGRHMYTDEDAKKFREAFEAVRNAGEHKSKRSNSTGIGKTLEDAIGVLENNIDAPDLHGFEIKGQRALTESLVTLVTKSPTSKKKVNAYLRQNFGYPDSEIPNVKVLHATIYHGKWSDIVGGYGYKLRLDEANQRLYVDIRETSTKRVLAEQIYWEYEFLRKKFDGKLKHLAFVQSSTREDGRGFEWFTFKHCTLYSGVTFERFKTAILNDQLAVDIRLGVYRTGSNKGKLHDHGTAFRVKKENLTLLYPHQEKI